MAKFSITSINLTDEDKDIIEQLKRPLGVTSRVAVIRECVRIVLRSVELQRRADEMDEVRAGE